MNSKLITAATVAAFSLAISGSVYAQGLNVGVSANAEARIGEAKVKTQATGSAETRGNENASMKSDRATTTRGNATSTGAKPDKAATSTEEKRGNGKSEEHRSEVAGFVHSLLSIADREGGIGAEVRAVAQAQNDSASTTVEALAKVEDRGAFRTFLFGTDYKSLGVIRAGIATTSASIGRLEAALAKAVTAEGRTELEAQINVLESQKADLEAFIADNESKFSLFGWFNRPSEE